MIEKMNLYSLNTSFISMGFRKFPIVYLIRKHIYNICFYYKFSSNLKDWIESIHPLLYSSHSSLAYFKEGPSCMMKRSTPFQSIVISIN